MRQLLYALALSLIAVALTHCGGVSDNSTSSTSNPEPKTVSQMSNPVYELAVRKVKAGQLDAFKAARKNFITLLKQVDGAEVDREFESFYALPQPDDSEVFIGMTKWTSMEAAGAAADQLMSKPEAGAFFGTFDFKAYVMIQPTEGPDFDLATLAAQPGQVLEIGVRKLNEGMEAEFEKTRKAFVSLLDSQKGVLGSYEFQVVGGQNTEGLTVGMTVYESQDAFQAVSGAIMQAPETQAYFATFVPQASQFAFSTTNQ